jgi:hypothetical protein
MGTEDYRNLLPTAAAARKGYSQLVVEAEEARRILDSHNPDLTVKHYSKPRLRLEV